MCEFVREGASVYECVGGGEYVCVCVCVCVSVREVRGSAPVCDSVLKDKEG